MSCDIRLRNNVRVFGGGKQPIVFVHGFGCDQNVWRFVAPAFEEDYKVVLFDYVGAGRSDISAYNRERYANLNGYAEDILEVCDALALKNAILVGHSVSSMTSLLAAIREPELFQKLVLVAPSPRYLDDPPEYIGGFERSDIEGLLDAMDRNYIGWANFLAPTIMKNPDKPELTRELEQSFCSTDPAIAKQFAEVTFFSDNRADLPNLQVPALIMQCSDDTLAPLEVGEYVRRQLRYGTLRVLKATGHCPHMSAPEETIDVMKEYLGELAGREDLQSLSN